MIDFMIGGPVLLNRMPLFYISLPHHKKDILSDWPIGLRVTSCGRGGSAQRKTRSLGA